ncbi:recombinase family protein [Candidatus Williamhamiltonella defendens]|uniref:recombinase family protein n=1 Tax=Candidatus Williamhamiltonella defendens TaxID=138072 RepID=UPI000930F847
MKNSHPTGEPHLQLDDVKQAGCKRIFEETVSRSKRERQELLAAINFIRHSDTLVIWKLD